MKTPRLLTKTLLLMVAVFGVTIFGTAAFAAWIQHQGMSAEYQSKGTAIAKIGLAVNRVWTNEAGEKKEEVTFVDVDVFGRTAENVGQLPVSDAAGAGMLRPVESVAGSPEKSPPIAGLTLIELLSGSVMVPEFV